MMQILILKDSLFLLKWPLGYFSSGLTAMNAAKFPTPITESNNIPRVKLKFAKHI